MCGRYSLTADLDTLQVRFGFQAGDLGYEPRYNVAPTQEVLTVTRDGSEHHAQFMKWGLIPYWAKDASIGSRMINARAETVVEKPGYREAFQERRCLVIADGFYEWRREGKLKTPMRIVLKNGEPFGFAGLWETWKNQEGERTRSCTIITTLPNALMESIHNRMPVMLTRDAEELWLDPSNKGTADLRELLVPYDPSDMDAYRVSDLVNKYQNDMYEVTVPVQ